MHSQLWKVEKSKHYILSILPNKLLQVIEFGCSIKISSILAILQRVDLTAMLVLELIHAEGISNQCSNLLCLNLHGVEPVPHYWPKTAVVQEVVVRVSHFETSISYMAV